MIKIHRLVFNPFQENTYIIYDETKECVIVDCGCYTVSEQDEITSFISENQLIPKYAINTHCHIDHVLGITFVKEKYGIEAIAHGEELLMLQMLPQHALMFGISIDSAPEVEITVSDGDTIKFGNTELKVIHTPGHTRGGICFYSEVCNFLVSGDTLFEGSIGRTDLPGGNYDTIIGSIKAKLLTLNQTTTVYPGHGSETTIAIEKSSNPFLTEK
jgi:glyoxylase-like metal-dependent hydrolase (beta-lactamase superfamily II)